MGALAAIGVVLPVASVGSASSHGSRAQEGLRENLFVADDRRPWGEASETSEIVLTRFRVQVGDANLRLLPAELGLVLRDVARGFTLGAAGLLGRCRSSVGFWGRSSFRFGGGGGCAVLRFLRVGRLGGCAGLLSSSFGWFFLLIRGGRIVW